jgi:D-threo-aldose 1-dehydrogenase
LRNRDGWILSSKVGRLLKPRREPHDPTIQWKDPHPFDPIFDYTYDAIMRSYDDSMQRLGMSRIDILYIHDIDVFSHGGEETQAKQFRIAMDEAYKALDELRRNGDIKAIGLGVNESGPISDAMEHGQWDCFLLAGRYTLLEQEPLHTLFPSVEKHGASIVIGGPFNSGILVGGDTWNYQRAPENVVERVKNISRVCASHNVPLAAAAIQFPLKHPLVASVIPGPRSTTELNEISDWWKIAIPAALWSDLKAEKLIDEASPTSG